MSDQHNARGRRRSGGRVPGLAQGAAEMFGRLTRFGLQTGAYPLRVLPESLRSGLFSTTRGWFRASALFPRAVADAIDEFAIDFGGADKAAGRRGEAALDEPGLHTHRDRGKDVAIVFIHGFGQNIKNTWGEFPDFLEQEPTLDEWDIYSIGYVTSLLVDLAGLWASAPPIDKLALQVKTIATNPPLDRYKSLAIIAHSMGGLVSQRALVDFEELEDRVGHLIMYGTPSNGLKKAAAVKFWKRQIRDMAAGGEFITDLRARWTQRMGERPDFEFLALAGDVDEFVPAWSSIDPFPERFRAVVPGDHMSMANPPAPETLNVQVLINFLRGEAAPAGPWNSARVAVERRDFQRAIDELWPHREELDDPTLVMLSLALDSVGRGEDAIQVLEQSGRESTDLMGTLAGRLKRRWLTERRLADAERAQELYRNALEIAEAKKDAEQAYYHAINVAFMALAHADDLGEAQRWARRALDHCEQAREDHWRLATEGEANLYLGEDDEAIDFYERALDRKPRPWQIASMFQQAVRVAELLDREPTAGRLREVFRRGRPASLEAA